MLQSNFSPYVERRKVAQTGSTQSLDSNKTLDRSNTGGAPIAKNAGI